MYILYIKTEILTIEGEVQLIKVRGHAGIPGNEFADDFATAVASTGQADLNMSDVESNHRPYQEWPMQKVWEEDKTSADGLRERWQQVENLEDALTSRVLKAKELRPEKFKHGLNLLSSHKKHSARPGYAICRHLGHHDRSDRRDEEHTD
jgi:hypothetical protein